jgi:hypothetical protein
MYGNLFLEKVLAACDLRWKLSKLYSEWERHCSASTRCKQVRDNFTLITVSCDETYILQLLSFVFVAEM